MYNPTFYLGVVEDDRDPLEIGRARVRVIGIHSLDETDIPTSSLPWAQVLMPVTSASAAGMGMTPRYKPFSTWVLIYFLDGEDKQQPLIMGTLPSVANPSGSYVLNGEAVSWPGKNAYAAGSDSSTPPNLGNGTSPADKVVSYDEFGNPITQAQQEGKVGLDAFGDGYKVADTASGLQKKPGESSSDFLDRARKATGNSNLQLDDHGIADAFADNPKTTRTGPQ